MRRFRDLSIKAKLMAIVVGTSFIILAAGLVLVTVYSMARDRNQLAVSAVKNAELSSEYAVVPLAFGDTAQATKNLLGLRRLPAVRKAVIYDENGQLFAEYRADGEEDVPSVEPRAYHGEFRDGYFHVFRPVEREGTTYGTLYLAVSTAELTDQLRGNIFVFSIALVVLVVVAYVLASLFQRALTEPVRRLARVMGTVRGSPDSSTRISWPGDDEIGALYDGFNSMLARIERAQRELRKSEAQHRTIITSMSDIIFLIDKDDRFVEVYGDLGSAMYVPADAFVGKTVGEVMPPEVAKEYARLAGAVRRTGESGRMEHSVEVKGEKKWYSANIDLHEDGESLVATIRNVTDRKALIERLNQSEKMEAVGLLAGGVAHDFNNMLVGIMSAAELLKSAGDDAAAREEYLAMITGSAARAAELTGKLLAFARKGKLTTAPMDVNQTIVDTVTLLQRSVDKRIEVTATLNASGLTHGDQTQLQNAFLNLGINAAHAMPEGGEIRFVTLNVKVTHDYCRQSGFELAPGDYVAVEVRDTGCGIAEEDMDRIFEPFFTTKEKGRGTGLGLAAVYGTVTEHKGEITVASTVGEGTVFTILLPLHAADEHAEEERDDELAYGQGKVLVVDDEPVNRKVAVALLRKLGYEALAAAGGAEAVEMFRGDHESIDLVVLDIQMPAMSGRECFGILREIDPEVRAVICSGYLRDIDIEELMGEGLRGYIQKPYQGVEFSRVIADAIQQAA